MSIMKRKRINLDYVLVKENEKGYVGEFEKNITMSTSFLVESFEVFRGEEFKDNESTNDIIKAFLPNDYEKAMEVLDFGFEYNGVKYVELLSTPSSMKKEDTIEEESYRLEMLFIKEEIKEFKSTLERLLSANKIAEKKAKKEKVYVNKDITSRLALCTTDSDRVNYKPHICVVPEYTYNYLAKYSYYDMETQKFVPQAELDTIDHTVSDGCGLMSNSMSQIIQEQLELDYRVDFAIIRGYTLAIKGVVVRFNFADYFKANGHNTITDIWGVEHKVDEIDLLLNETQTKFAKNWKNENGTAGIELLNKEYEKEFYKPYKHLLDALYISKVNKNPLELPKYIKLNYQVLQALAMTDEDIMALSEQDRNYYSKLLSFEDIDALRLFIGDMARCKDDEEIATISDRLQFELKVHPIESLEDDWVRSQIRRMVKKKLLELSGGKITTEGGIKLIAGCPISYCNAIMNNGDTGNNGLKEHEFYVKGMSNQNVTIYRNPLMMLQEVQRIKLVDTLDQWIDEDFTSEVIFFNEKDNTCLLLSGADKLFVCLV